MQSVPDVPSCLHVPTFYRGATANITWQNVDAVGYELQVSVDETFENAAKGVFWDGFDEAQNTWNQMDGECTWAQFEDLNAKGNTWQRCEFLDCAWDELDAQNKTWGQKSQLPQNLTIFHGEGSDVDGPDLGLTWLEIRKKDRTWAQLAALQKSWGGFRNESTMGLSWNSGEGWFENWQKLDAEEITWNGWEQHPSDTEAHKSFEMEAPGGASKAFARLCAHDEDGEISSWKNSGAAFVASISQLDVFTQNAEVSFWQLAAKNAQLSPKSAFLLRYPSHMRLVAFAPPAEQTMVSATRPQLMWTAEGMLAFICMRPVGEGKLWSGLVAALTFDNTYSMKSRMEMYQVSI